MPEDTHTLVCTRVCDLTEGVGVRRALTLEQISTEPNGAMVVRGTSFWHTPGFYVNQFLHETLSLVCYQLANVKLVMGKRFFIFRGSKSLSSCRPVSFAAMGNTPKAPNVPFEASIKRRHCHSLPLDLCESQIRKSSVATADSMRFVCGCVFRAGCEGYIAMGCKQYVL